MNKYNVGDIVKFNKNNGGYDGIENHGEIMKVFVNKNGGIGYDVRVHDIDDNCVCTILYFHEDEIAERVN